MEQRVKSTTTTTISSKKKKVELNMDQDAGAGKDFLSSEGPAQELHANEKLMDMEKGTTQKGGKKNQTRKIFSANTEKTYILMQTDD